jgi:hypothetical protein
MGWEDFFDLFGEPLLILVIIALVVIIFWGL